MINISEKEKRKQGKDRVVKCPRCLDHGYITLVKDKDGIPYEYFFACQCEVGKSRIENPIGKTFKNGDNVKTQIRDYRAALHQGYRFSENSDHVRAYDNFRGTGTTVQRGAYID
jgi:hypothetical protein